jgi:sarcosine oxidase subunit alpha
MGIEFADSARLPKECHLVIDDGAIAGRITSVVHSRTLNQGIGLAMLAPHFTVGSSLQIRGDGGEMLQARVVPLPFYDPQNLRQRQSAAP